MERPVFSLVAVASLDGRIARDSAHFTGWSSREDKAFLHSFLGQSDAVVVGMNTWAIAKARLSRRNCIVLTSSVEGAVEKRRGLVFLNPSSSNLPRFLADSRLWKIAVLGGTKTYSYFLDNGLVGHIFLTVEPIVFGSGLGVFESPFRLRKFRLVSCKKLGKSGAVLLHYSKK